MLNKIISERIGKLHGKIGVYYKDLNSGFSFYEGNSEIFNAAGLSKLFLLIETLRQIEDGILTSDAVHILKQKDKVPSIGALSSLHEGIELTIEDLSRVMISVGDNTAFNILLEKVGIEPLNETLKIFGYENSKIRRAFFDQVAIENGIENTVSIIELGDLFERLYRGQLISKKVSHYIIELLKNQQRDYIIPYHFSELVSVAHQMGEDDGLRHDCGIVFSKNPFVICMCSEEVDVRVVQDIMRDIAMICMRYSNKAN